MMDSSQDGGVTWRRGSEVKRGRREMEIQISFDRSAVNWITETGCNVIFKLMTLACSCAMYHTILSSIDILYGGLFLPSLSKTKTQEEKYKEWIQQCIFLL